MAKRKSDPEAPRSDVDVLVAKRLELPAKSGARLDQSDESGRLQGYVRRVGKPAPEGRRGPGKHRPFRTQHVR